MPETVLVLARLGLGAVFLAAGVAKLIDRAEFEKHLPAFGLRWPGVARGMSYGLPALECVLGLMLIAGLLVEVAAPAAVGLLLAFTVVVAVALVRRTTVSCGCFGNIGRGRVTGMTLARNFGLLIIAGSLSMVSVPVASQPIWASLTLGMTLSMVILLTTQFLNLKPAFLALPALESQSNVRWIYVDPSVRFKVQRLPKWSKGVNRG